MYDSKPPRLSNQTNPYLWRPVVVYEIGWELGALIKNLASFERLKSVEQYLYICFKIRLWIHIQPFV
ncbi:hypothetical protein HanXRQr2_Chr01g0025151 [Helianthus annuus]|uniref:Uncharacterized protein n=1 Tax=Helianthus annuus TaxID=4232 RepID=A0A9K3JV70_HELAN|nr:hypothetical protein HanXRQr2_Chr01g0025151 [Helianthus annuus]KAJ0957188.1 hypothetical protein HanPSC8_Chr01g0024291 [Helianthus annuus]